jgi:ATP-binding cassette subfamily B protein
MILSSKNYNLCDTVKIPFKCSPILSFSIVTQIIITAALPTLQVIITASFINVVLNTVTGRGSIHTIYLPLFLLLLLLAYQWISDALTTLGQKRLEYSLREKFRVAITEKHARLKYHYIENPKTLDLINRVSDMPETKISDGFSNLLSGISLIIRIAGLMVLLVAQVWWAAITITIISAPLFYLAIKSGRATYKANKETTKYRRQYEYLSNVMTARDGVDERSIFRYSKKLNDIWFQKFEVARKIELKAQLKWFIKLKSGSVITALISMVITTVLLKPVVSGVISLGMYISLVNATFGLVHSMSWDLIHCVDTIANHMEYLKDLTEFTKMSEETAVTDIPAQKQEFESLVFENVSFKYPNTENYILKGLSMELHAGKHYAFVGINGAGKTTITKLLTGLYGDFEGRISLNGKDIKNYSQSQLKALFSVAYQDFAKYYITLKENIALGDVRYCTDEHIQESIEHLHLTDVVKKLPNGLDNYLGKIKKTSQDISGGEWQRVALCRTTISQAPVCILDEPTAALDPVSESNLYHEFEHLSQNKTTIFISHRLGSTKLADEIFVLGSGRLLEHGTHGELMLFDSIYKDMYESQRSWYK